MFDESISENDVFTMRSLKTEDNFLGVEVT